MAERALKEWRVDIWLVLRNGLPHWYHFSRAAAFQDAKNQRKANPKYFWSVTSATGTLSIRGTP